MAVVSIADISGSVSSVAGDTLVTNALLAWMAFELRRAFPYLRALCDHFRLKVRPRAESEPAS